ncbi:DUF655 domain-containing protein [Promethearchaeum syntrophicum]|uniref:DUF655 domain-containing protein n=1 Tax=Promethearchaeum syntrophicum TaxID=2594042 RepID=A0A5B9D867_9ARCH|nr:DUF655 domain-containing protein [Candidatus Prometheoarchaeum syntrophicum]QEE15067.1 hypothetical protein DSAG12_00890 [Candidatus Prometheoarchaeum syntrophicum]
MSDRRNQRYDGNNRRRDNRSQGNYRGRSSRSGYKSNRDRTKFQSTLRLHPGTEIYILDILQHGGIDKADHQWNPIAQILEGSKFQLYEIRLNKSKITERRLQEKIVVTENQDIYERIQRKITFLELTPTSSSTLDVVVAQYVNENEPRFIEFINNSGPITIKRHSLEVLPGIGKKLMWEIINNREKPPFKSFEDLHSRVPGFKPVETFRKRIIEEIMGDDLKHYLFVKRSRKRG